MLSLDPLKNVQNKFTNCAASYKPFYVYRKRSLQQNGDMRKRNEKEDCMHVECSRLQGHTLSPPQEYSAANFRSNFLQQFSTVKIRSNFPQQFSA
jgi:hypothetical protein